MLQLDLPSAGALSESNPEIAALLAGDPTAFRYLSQTGCLAADGSDDEALFQHTVEGLRSVGIDGLELRGVMGLLVAILLLGNLKFEERKDDDDAEDEPGREELGSAKVRVATEDRLALELVATLLGVSPVSLELSLVLHIMVSARNTVIPMPLDLVKAQQSRDSMSKSMYGLLFGWLVSRINRSISEAEPAENRRWSVPTAFCLTRSHAALTLAPAALECSTSLVLRCFRGTHSSSCASITPTKSFSRYPVRPCETAERADCVRVSSSISSDTYSALSCRCTSRRASMLTDLAWLSPIISRVWSCWRPKAPAFCPCWPTRSISPGAQTPDFSRSATPPTQAIATMPAHASAAPRPSRSNTTLR